MKIYVYVVKDIIAGECGPTFDAKNDEVALRNINRMLKDVEEKDEFELYCIGGFDRETLTWTTQEIRKVIIPIIFEDENNE